MTTIQKGRKHVNEYKKEPENSVSSTFLMVKTVLRGLKLTQKQCYGVIKQGDTPLPNVSP